MRSKFFVFLVLSAILGGIVLVVIDFAYPNPATKEQRVAIWVPQNAELRARNTVSPGTFKIETSYKEFQELTWDQGVLVVYDPYWRYGNLPKVDYWGFKNGVFYHTVIQVDKPPSELKFPASIFSGQAAVFDKESVSYVFRDAHNPGLCMLLGLLVVFFTFLLTVVSFRLRSQAKKARI